jgi:hypothetical protein
VQLGWRRWFVPRLEAVTQSSMSTPHLACGIPPHAGNEWKCSGCSHYALSPARLDTYLHSPSQYIKTGPKERDGSAVLARRRHLRHRLRLVRPIKAHLSSPGLLPLWSEMSVARPFQAPASFALSKTWRDSKAGCSETTKMSGADRKGRRHQGLCRKHGSGQIQLWTRFLSTREAAA